MPSVAKSSVVDSGALIALLDRRDQHHDWAQRTFRQLHGPWLTCEPVLTEAFFQLEEITSLALSKLLRRGLVQLAFDLEVELTAVLDLREKYWNVPMSLADACLVRMSEILPDPVVVTTDADFRIYRREGSKAVPVLMP
jgi:predicted nucleic acid-binding protein